jgi:hypothetical protein
VIPPFDDRGLLPLGVHEATWEEFADRFGTTEHRRRLLAGLARALRALSLAGCERVYINGSYVTAKESPGDFDGCWSLAGVDPTRVDPVLLDFSRNRAAQKAKYLGELFVAEGREGGSGRTWLAFFQLTRSQEAKGIVSLDPRNVEPAP